MVSSRSKELTNLWITITPEQFEIVLLKKYKQHTENQEKIGKFIKLVFDEIKGTGFANYTSLQELDWDIGIRAHTLYAMDEMNKKDAQGKSKFGFAKSTSTFATQSNLWQRKPLKIVQVGESATEALDDLFVKGALLECERAADACVLSGVAKAFACNNCTEHFDNLYQNKKLQLISSFGWHQGQCLAELPTNIIPSGTSMLPGDRRYFINLANYLVFNPGGFASGENVIHMGRSGDDTYYQGLNTPLLTETQLFQLLANWYDHDCQALINFVYEKLDLKFTPWSSFFPNAYPASLAGIQALFQAAVNDYKESIKPSTLTQSNFNDHRSSLTTHYVTYLAGKIKQANTDSQYNHVRRIDVLALLEKAHVPEEDPVLSFVGLAPEKMWNSLKRQAV